MGQIIGKFNICEEAQPFVNLPGENVKELIEAFNLISENFMISLQEAQEIFLVSLRECHRRQCDDTFQTRVKKFFTLFVDDETKNVHVVDSFEFLAALIISSDMNVKDKIRRIVALYDFNGKDLFTINEITLSMRSAVSGMCRMAKLERPDKHCIDFLASLPFSCGGNAFSVYDENAKARNTMVSLKELAECIVSIPEIRLWLEHFNDLEEVDVPICRKIPNPCINSSEVFDHQMDLTKVKAVDWEEMVQLYTKPSNDKDYSSTFSSIPHVDIKLEWIYGRNTKKVSSNNAHYTAKGHVIYPAGATVVKYVKHTGGLACQHFYTGHSNYISCIAVSPCADEVNGTIIATSEYSVSTKPLIQIWSSESLSTLQTLTGFHSNGVQCIDFSPSGDLLLTVGMDEMHSVAIYRWKERKILYTTRTSSNSVSDCRFLGSDKRFGACGDSFLHIWDCEDQALPSYVQKKGLFGKSFKIQALTCLLSLQDKIISGAQDGNIFVWEGRSCIQTLETPNKKSQISAMSISKDGSLGVGTAGGTILVYNEELELTGNYRINSSVAGLHRIDSLCCGQESLLVGTASSKLMEISKSGGAVMNEITRGHAGKYSCGLATNPLNSDEVATVGDDGILLIFDSRQKCEIKTSDLECSATFICYSNNGKHLVVGLHEPNVGAFLVLNRADLSTELRGRPCKTKVLTDCKYSKDGKFLAFGCADHNIYIYDAKKYTLISRATGHTTPVSHVDFGYSSDLNGTCTVSLRSNSINNEVMFWSTNGKHLTPISQRKSTFETCTCPVTWEMKGVHTGATIHKIKACDRSNKGDKVATVNNTGKLKIFRFPAFGKKCMYAKVSGHGGDAGNVKFSKEDKHLFTLGRYDCCLMQWSYHDRQTNSTEAEHLQEDLEVFGTRQKFPAILKEQQGLNEVDFQSDKPGSKYLKPWEKSIVEPSSFDLPNTSKPPQPYLLDWVFGYNGSCPNNIFYAPENKIVYPIGKTIVAFDTVQHKQFFYQEATDIITSIAIHPRRNICALGQGDESFDIPCLDYESMREVQVLKGPNQATVTNMKFNRSGRLLITISADSCHTMAIYDWDVHSSPIVTSLTSVSPIYDVVFTNNGSILQAGENFLRFWSINQRAFSFRDAKFGKEGKMQSFYSTMSCENILVVGTEDGNLYKMVNCEVAAITKACDTKSPILSLNSCPEGIISGSKDGCIILWDYSLLCKLKLTLKDLVGSFDAEIRSICWCSNHGKVVVGTDRNELYEFSSFDGSNLHEGAVVSGPFGKTLSGITISDGPVCATTGDDRILRLWNTDTKKLLKLIQLDMASQCCTFNPDGNAIAVGYGSPRKIMASETHGKWVIIDVTTSSIIFETRPSRKMITEIKWSDNNIAIGSQDCKVYLYKVEQMGRGEKKSTVVSNICTIDQHYSPITAIDFSEDSKFVKVNCSHNLHFFNVEDGNHIEDVSSIKDVKWKTHHCARSWDMKGIWYHSTSGAVVECVDSWTGTENKIVVAGFNDGNFQLFHYPCAFQQSSSRTLCGHYKRIGRVRWINDEQFISIGGDDKAIMIWKAYQKLDNQNEGGDDEETEERNLDQDTSSQRHEEEKRTKSSKWDIEKQPHRPWVASVVAPSSAPDPEKKMERPNEDLKLSTINCFDGEYLHCVNPIDIITNCGSICIVNNTISNQQQYFRGHKGEISCIAISKSKPHLVASGDKGEQPSFRVWDVNTCNEIFCSENVHVNGIQHLEFADEDRLIMSIGSEYENYICVWRSYSGEWFDGKLWIKVQAGTSIPNFLTVLGLCDYFVTGEEDGITFWSYRTQNTVAPTKSIVMKNRVEQSMLCGAEFGYLLVTGATNGHLYIWEGQTLSSKIVAHDRGVTCLLSLKCHAGLISGSMDGTIITWSTDFEKQQVFDIKQQHIRPMSDFSLVQSLSSYQNEACVCNKIVVGSKGNGVYEISTLSSEIKCFKEAHSDSISDVAFHPNEENIYATCEDVGMLRIWNHEDCSVVKRVNLKSSLSSLSWSHDGDQILVGCINDSTSVEYTACCFIVDCNSMDIKWKGKGQKESILHVKFGPKSDMFALVDEDNKVYIYDNKGHCNDFYKPKLRVLTSFHRANIMSIDFSKDSYFIQTSSADYEHIRFNTDDGDIMNLPSQQKNIEWETYTCPFGWHAQGLWPPVSESLLAPEPTCVDRSDDGNLLVAGFSNGEVRLYQFPCVSNQAKYRVQKLHVGPVSKCSFNRGSSLLITLGEQENAVAVWRLCDECQCN